MQTSNRSFLSRVEPTLPSRYYFAQDIYDLEKERFFYDMWFCVGRADEIAEPGEFLVREVGDESIIIVRDKTGQLSAFYNVCRHRGTRLCTASEGRFDGNAFSCRYHGWTYSLDGKLLATPNMLKAKDFDKGEYPLYSVGLETWEGLMFVNMGTDRKPLSSQLGDTETRWRRYHMGELKLGKHITYDIEANWKIIIENYMECLHCPLIHPELCEVVPLYRQGLVAEPDGAYHTKLIDGGYTFTSNGKTTRPLFRDLNEEEKKTYGGAVIFPNLILNLHPDCVNIQVLWPESPTRTKVVCEWLFEPSTMERSDFDSSDIVEFWDRINRQDWEVCQLVQLGVRSTAHQHGVYAPQENYLYEFDQYVLEHLERR